MELQRAHLVAQLIFEPFPVIPRSKVVKLENPRIFKDDCSVVLFLDVRVVHDGTHHLVQPSRGLQDRGLGRVALAFDLAFHAVPANVARLGAFPDRKPWETRTVLLHVMW
jgi:hypothetical protein